MHPVNLIASALRVRESYQPPVTPVVGICCLTGVETDCIPRKLMLGDSFTTQTVLAAPLSEYIGVDAAMALGHKWERMACWWTDGKEFRVIKRKEVRSLVLSGSPSTPWSGWITTSYKKHGALLAEINNTSHGVWAFDEYRVDCTNNQTVQQWWEIMTVAQQAGVWRTIQETLDCPPNVMAKIGLPLWTKFLTWATPRHQSSLYRLLCYLLPSQEEMKNAVSSD
jgi:hypothetical protein